MTKTEIYKSVPNSKGFAPDLTKLLSFENFVSLSKGSELTDSEKRLVGCFQNHNRWDLPPVTKSEIRRSFFRYIFDEPVHSTGISIDAAKFPQSQRYYNFPVKKLLLELSDCFDWPEYYSAPLVGRYARYYLAIFELYESYTLERQALFSTIFTQLEADYNRCILGCQAEPNSASLSAEMLDLHHGYFATIPLTGIQRVWGDPFTYNSHPLYSSAIESKRYPDLTFF